MNKKKIAIIVLFIILLILIATILRKYIIINDLKEKAETYIASTNYNMIATKNENGKTITYDYNKKDSKIAYFIKTNDSELLMYDNGNSVNCYTKVGETKTLTHEENLPNGGMINFLNNDHNAFQALLNVIKTNIKSTQINGKDCYLIKNYADLENVEIYIEKETGLCIQYIETNTDIKVNYSYEFNNVTDNTFIEPDASQYKEQTIEIKE